MNDADRERLAENIKMGLVCKAESYYEILGEPIPQSVLARGYSRAAQRIGTQASRIVQDMIAEKRLFLLIERRHHSFCYLTNRIWDEMPTDFRHYLLSRYNVPKNVIYDLHVAEKNTDAMAQNIEQKQEEASGTTPANGIDQEVNK